MKTTLHTYLSLCESFWKAHTKTFEHKMEALHQTKKTCNLINALSGFDAAYLLLINLKKLRTILPPEPSPEYSPAMVVLQQLKNECLAQIRAGIHPIPQ